MTSSLFRFHCASIVVGVLALCSAPAFAQLELDVPVVCRQEASALADSAFPEGLAASARLAVQAWRDRYRATVRTALGTRVLEGESCAAAVSAGLVFVALSVEPRAAPFLEPPPPAQHTAQVLTSPGESVQSEQRQSLRRPRKPLALRMNALGMWGSGALPGGGFGGGVAAGLGRGLGHAVAGLQGWGPRDAAASVAGTGGRFWMWTGLALGCVARPSGRLRPGACLGAAVGRVHGEGQGVKESEHARALWAAALAQLELRLQVVGGLSLLASAQPEVALVRRRFRLEGAGVVHQPKPLSLSAGLGMAYEFSWPR